MKFYLLFGFICLATMGCDPGSNSQQATADGGKTNEVHIVGAMKNVMHLGQLQGTIDLDTLQDQNHLYGLGPEEFLKGELLIVDGHAYRSKVVDDATMAVEETYHTKAPFFVYANVADWSSQPLPSTVTSLPELEAFLDEVTQEAPRPFAFRLVGTLQSATIHVVNLPSGSKVSSPEEAHRGQISYPVTMENVEIVGFFSTEHQAIFTHHDSFVHMHLINAAKTQMGHVEDIQPLPGAMTLYLPLGQ